MVPASEHMPQLFWQAGFKICAYFPLHPPIWSIMEQTVSGVALHFPPGQASPQNGAQSENSNIFSSLYELVN